MRRRRGTLVTVALASAVLAIALASCAFLDVEPVAQISVGPVIAYAGEPILLDAGDSHGAKEIVSYVWEVDGEQIALGREASIALSDPGRYELRLRVEDAGGRVATAVQELVVYLRSGSEILFEDFSDGETALARWALDPTWASSSDGTLEYIVSTRGYSLLIRSSGSRWHRRYMQIEIPPLRTGQRIVFSARIMTLQNQSEHCFFFAPARKSIDSMAGSLPYFLFTSEGGDSWVREPTAYGSEVGHPIAFLPDVYRWHTYTLSFGFDAYTLEIDGDLYFEGPWSAEPLDLTTWYLVFGDESLEEACKAYYDDIRITIEE